MHLVLSSAKRVIPDWRLAVPRRFSGCRSGRPSRGDGCLGVPTPTMSITSSAYLIAFTHIPAIFPPLDSARGAGSRRARNGSRCRGEIFVRGSTTRPVSNGWGSGERSPNPFPRHAGSLRGVVPRPLGRGDGGRAGPVRRAPAAPPENVFESENERVKGEPSPSTRSWRSAPASADCSTWNMEAQMT